MKKTTILLIGILAMILIPGLGGYAETIADTNALYQNFLDARKQYFDSKSDSTLSSDAIQGNYENYVQARNAYRNSRSLVQNTDNTILDANGQTTTGQRLRKRVGSNSGTGHKLRKRDGSGISYTGTQNTSSYNSTESLSNTNPTCDGTAQKLRKRDGSGNGQGKGRGRGRGNR